MSEHSAEKDALIREERWVPVTESGARWAGRGKEGAERCMRDVPVGGTWATGEPWDGIAHIEHEVRYVTEWRVIPPAETDGGGVA